MKKISLGQIIGIAAALLVVLLFFFPWVEFNLLLATANMTGFQLATGNGPAGASFPSVPSLLLIPLSMIGVLIVAAVALFGQNPASQLKRIASVLLITAGGISVLVILYQYFNLNAELNSNVLGFVAQKMFSYSFGAHGSLLGSVVVAGGGLIDLATRKKPTIPSP
ncbi:MAG TPA: hypothetical protein VIT88_02740 [Pyrinomonadaceae bacterium]